MDTAHRRCDHKVFLGLLHLYALSGMCSYAAPETCRSGEECANFIATVLVHQKGTMPGGDCNEGIDIEPGDLFAGR